MPVLARRSLARSDGRDGWNADDSSAFAAPSLRLTAHELAVTRLADDLLLEQAEDGLQGDGNEDDEASHLGGGINDISLEGNGGGSIAAPRFLSPHERQAQATLVSYPRSGNSLLRSLLESCSGVLTGSDTPRYAPLSRHLKSFGLAGEGVTDGRVWIVKSHWPERKGCAEVLVHAAVLLVRSPLDAIDSYWHFVLTQTHTHSVKESEYGRLAEEWNEHVSREATVWAAFHRHWLSARTPLLAIRYEDLLDAQRRAETLQLVAAFLYARAAPADGASPEAAAAALRGMLSRVQAAAREAADVQHAEAAEGVYQPRRGGVGGGQKRFSAEQRAELVSTLGAELALFKYELDPESPQFGMPLPGPPHAIYLDPTADPRAVAGTKPKPGSPIKPKAGPGRIVLNRGKPLRPSDDSRGWKWRESLAAKRDGSLIYGDEASVAHVERGF